MTGGAEGRRLDSLGEDELIRRAQAAPGTRESNQASGELLLRHQDRLYLWCFRFVRDHDRALDLAQDVMVLAHRALPGFEGRARFATWLYTIARHRCLREVGRQELLTDEEVDPDRTPALGGGPERAFEEHAGEEEILSLVREALEPRERLAIWLRCYQGMPVDSITELLDIREASGARGLLQAARRKLRVALERRHRREGSPE